MTPQQNRALLKALSDSIRSYAMTKSCPIGMSFAESGRVKFHMPMSKFSVSCNDNEEALIAMANKIYKGATKDYAYNANRIPPRTPRSYNLKTRLEGLAAECPENATQYRVLLNLEE